MARKRERECQTSATTSERGGWKRGGIGNLRLLTKKKTKIPCLDVLKVQSLRRTRQVWCI